jgi:hypothetical protein
MKMPQALAVDVRWLRFTLFTRPRDMFLSAIVTPADWWSFQHGKIDEFVDTASNDLADMRTAVLRVVRILGG